MRTRYGWLGLAALAAGLSVAETPSPALLVLNKEENAMVIVDPGSRKVVGRVPVGESPHELAASSDGKLAFASNYGTGRNPGHTISVIDVAAQKELRRVDLSPLSRPHGLAFADGKLYFTAEGNRLIGRYDPEANRIDWLFGTGQSSTHMVLVSHDRNRVFTANIGSDSITAMERGPQGWGETVIPVGKGPEGMDLSPDGKELWTAQSRDAGVSIIDVAAGKVVGTIDLGTKRSNRLKFTPDGKHVLISDMGGGELVVVDAAERRQTKRMKIGPGPEGILMDPDGTRAFVAVAGENQVAIIDLRTFEETGRIATGRGPDGMAWASR
jgi:DNA-binding beta-propeller fold protein YncE